MPGLDRSRPLTDSRPICIDVFVGLTPWKSAGSTRRTQPALDEIAENGLTA